MSTVDRFRLFQYLTVAVVLIIATMVNVGPVKANSCYKDGYKAGRDEPFSPYRFSQCGDVYAHGFIAGCLDASTNERLDAQLNAALLFAQHKINSGSCGHLRGFVIQVQVALKVGYITQSEAAQLIGSAHAIKTALHC